MLLRFLNFFIFSIYLSFPKGNKQKDSKKNANSNKGQIVNKDIKLKQCCNGCKCSGTIRQYQEKKFIFRDKIIRRYNNISIMFGTDKKGSRNIKGIGIKGPDEKTVYERLTRSDKQILSKLEELKSYSVKVTSNNISELVNKIHNNKKYNYKKKEYKPIIPEQIPKDSEHDDNKHVEQENINVEHIKTEEIDNNKKKYDVEMKQINNNDGLEQHKEQSNELSKERKMTYNEEQFTKAVNSNKFYCLTDDVRKNIKPVGIDRIKRGNLNVLLGKYGFKNNSYEDNTSLLNRINDLVTIYCTFQKIKSNLSEEVKKFIDDLCAKIPEKSKIPAGYSDYVSKLLKIYTSPGEYNKSLADYAKDLTKELYDKGIGECDKYILDYEKKIYKYAKEIMSINKNTDPYNKKIDENATKLADLLFDNVTYVNSDKYDKCIYKFGDEIRKCVQDLIKFQEGSEEYKKKLKEYAEDFANVVVMKDAELTKNKQIDSYTKKIKKYLKEYIDRINEYKGKLVNYISKYYETIEEYKKNLDFYTKEKIADQKKEQEYDAYIANDFKKLVEDSKNDKTHPLSVLKKVVRDVYDFVSSIYSSSSDAVKKFDVIMFKSLFVEYDSKYAPILLALKGKDINGKDNIGLSEASSNAISLRRVLSNIHESNENYEFDNKEECEHLSFEITEEEIKKEKEEAEKLKKQQEEEDKKAEKEELNRFNESLKNYGATIEVVKKIDSLKNNNGNFDPDKFCKNVFNNLFKKGEKQIIIDSVKSNGEIDKSQDIIKNIIAYYKMFMEKFPGNDYKSKFKKELQNKIMLGSTLDPKKDETNLSNVIDNILEEKKEGCKNFYGNALSNAIKDRRKVKMCRYCMQELAMEDSDYCSLECKQDDDWDD